MLIILQIILTLVLMLCMESPFNPTETIPQNEYKHGSLNVMAVSFPLLNVKIIICRTPAKTQYWDTVAPISFEVIKNLKWNQ